MNSKQRAVLIAGPTACGKSGLALRIAEREGGVIINTDSMQIYSVLDVLTARPQAEELKRAPHFLYGYVDPGQPYSTGAWLSDVRELTGKAGLSGKTLIFVGGTGLYFRALLGGLSQMPEIPDPVRQRWRYRLAEEGASKLHRVLRASDPEAAMTIKPADGQRIVRALEVIEVSGRSILHWQSVKGSPAIDAQYADKYVIEPDRTELDRVIAARLDRMLEAGALQEVKALLALELDESLPAMKAIGVREFRQVLEGSLSLDKAKELVRIATRQYAKRQSTWFRNQCGDDWRRIPADFETI